MKKIEIFKGKTIPTTMFIGIRNQPNVIKDRSGTISKGRERICIIDTKWGQLQVPTRWMNKNIVIKVLEKSK